MDWQGLALVLAALTGLVGALSTFVLPWLEGRRARKAKVREKLLTLVDAVVVGAVCDVSKLRNFYYGVRIADHHPEHAANVNRGFEPPQFNAQAELAQLELRCRAEGIDFKDFRHCALKMHMTAIDCATALQIDEDRKIVADYVPVADAEARLVEAASTLVGEIDRKLG